jgi:hypothetical protein
MMVSQKSIINPLPSRTGHLVVNFNVKPFAGVWSLFSRTLSVYLDNFWQIAQITLLVICPLALISIYLSLNIPFAMGPLSYPALIIGFILRSLIFTVIIHSLVEKFKNGTSSPIADSFRWGFRQWGRMLLYRFVSGFAILLGTILVIPGQYLAVLFYLVEPVVAIEGDRQKNILERSVQLSKGYRWKIYGFFLSITIFMGIVQVGFILNLSFLNISTVPTILFGFLVLSLLESFLDVSRFMVYLSLTCGASEARTSGNKIDGNSSNEDKNLSLYGVSTLKDWILYGFDGEGRKTFITFGEKDFEPSNNGLVFGRDDNLSNIVVKDKSVSRRHFRIVKNSNRLGIEDLNSSNGTFVNGKPIKPYQVEFLMEEANISVGRVTLTFSRS